MTYDHAILGASVAVIIVTWNSTKFIADVLSCLDKQLYKPTRVIIIDNGSEDFLDLQKIITPTFDYVELISLQKNIGFAAANNIGIKLCKNMELIALLNPDAFPEPQWLKEMVAAIERYPDFSFFSSRQMQLGNRILDGAGDGMSICGKPYRRAYGEELNAKYLTDTAVFGACAAAAVYKVGALKETGGFDEDFFCYVEDVDLSFRMQLMGHRCMYVADAVVTHVGSASLGKRSDFAVFHGQRNMVICFFKNMPILALIWLIPFHILANIFFLCASVFLGKFGLVFRAKREAIKSLWTISEKRKIIQKNRKISYVRIFSMLRFSFP